MKKIGDRVRMVRKSIPLKQKVFAARIGIQPNYASQIENNHKTPSPHLLKTICLEFNIMESWLTDGKGPMHPEPPPMPAIAESTSSIDNQGPQNTEACAKGGGTPLHFNLEKIFKKYPQLKYALVFADDENEEELRRVIDKWAKDFSALGEERGAPKLTNQPV